MNSFISIRPPGRSSRTAASSAAPASSETRASSVSRIPVSFGARSRQQHAGGAAERGNEGGDRVRIAHVAHQHRDVRSAERRHGGQIDADHPSRRSDSLRCDLQPGAWPRPQIGDAIARAQDAKAIVELDQLVRAARPVAGRPGAPEVRIVALVRHPRRPCASRRSVRGPGRHEDLPAGFDARPRTRRAVEVRLRGVERVVRRLVVEDRAGAPGWETTKCTGRAKSHSSTKPAAATG